MQNYRLTLAYDGTRYRGWQRLPPPAKTVQASVETALGDIFGQPLEISGSGRTDAGVHAACQVASFHAPKRPTDEVLGQLRRLLPEDIGALTLDYAPERFTPAFRPSRRPMSTVSGTATGRTCSPGATAPGNRASWTAAPCAPGRPGWWERMTFLRSAPTGR